MKKRYTAALLCIIAVILATYAIVRFSPVHIPEGAAEKISMYTRNKPNAEITVAVVNGKETSVRAYGHDGREIPVPERSYEIGQITRTFTGALAAEVFSDGLILPDAPVSDVFRLSAGAYVPTVFELLTHSSAYSSYSPGVLRSKGNNPYSGITGNDVVSDMNSFRLSEKPPYLYSDSDFGAAALGAVISKLYDVDFYSILTIFTQDKLGLENTFVALEECTEGGWKWNYEDAYIASRGFTSNIQDMVKYAGLYLDGENPLLEKASDPLCEINAESFIGYMWMISHSGRVLSMSGETAHYSAAIIIDKNNHSAAVVLSNYPNDKYGNTADIANALLKEAISA